MTCRAPKGWQRCKIGTGGAHLFDGYSYEPKTLGTALLAVLEAAGATSGQWADARGFECGIAVCRLELVCK